MTINFSSTCHNKLILLFVTIASNRLLLLPIVLYLFSSQLILYYFSKLSSTCLVYFLWLSSLSQFVSSIPLFSSLLLSSSPSTCQNFFYLSLHLANINLPILVTVIYFPSGYNFTFPCINHILIVLIVFSSS